MVVADAHPAHPGRLPRAELAAARVAVALAWPAALVAVLYAAIGRLGFNPTDDGSLLVQSYRILLGQVPHRDFISPRPAGTPILHTLNFFLPGPLYETARVTTLAEVVAYTILFAALVTGRAPWEWGVARSLVVVAAVMVNLHTFPLLTWHTIDGLLVISAGLVMITYGWERRAVFLLGFFLLGYALLVKQSFGPAGVLAAGYAIVRAWRREGFAPMLARVFQAGVVGLVPPVLYALVIYASGGGHDLVHQLRQAHPINGVDDLNGLWLDPVRVTTDFRAGCAVLVIAAGAGVLRSLRGGLLQQLALLACRLAVTGVLVWLLYTNGLARYGTWAVDLVLVALVVFLPEVVFARWRLVWAGLVLTVAAWMTSLSYGYAVPNLIAGSVAAGALLALWDEHDRRPSVLRAEAPLRAVAGLAGAGLVTFMFLTAWWTGPLYREPAAAQLTFRLGKVIPAFGGIRVDPVTGAYLAGMTSCISAHPARYVAVIPDNAGLYAALHLRNPLPLDWLWPDESAGSHDRLLAAATKLDSRGDFLVLSEISNGGNLASNLTLPLATPKTPPFGYDTLPPQIFDSLHGRRFTCGPFLGVYRP